MFMSDDVDDDDDVADASDDDGDVVDHVFDYTAAGLQRCLLL